MGQQSSQEASENSRAVAEGRTSSCHHLKQRKKHRVCLKATSNVDVSLHCGAGMLFWGPGQFPVGHIWTDIFHQCDCNNFSCLCVDRRCFIRVRRWSRAVETRGAATLDYDSKQSLDVLKREENDVDMLIHSRFWKKKLAKF